MRLLVVLVLSFILGCVPPAAPSPPPICSAKTIDFSVDTRFSSIDREAFADSALWWLQYGVVVKFHEDRDPEASHYLWLAFSDSKKVLEDENAHNRIDLALTYHTWVPTVLLVVDRLYTMEMITAVLNHEIGHILGMPDNKVDPEGLMYYTYKHPVQRLSAHDMMEFRKCRL